MPVCLTRDFGNLEFSSDAVLTFPEGLPAFEDERAFVLIERPESAPLVFLQSLGRRDLCFLALPAQSVLPGYQVPVTDHDWTRMGVAPSARGGLLTLVLLSINPDSAFTANLLAPVVVNLRSRHALQLVRADDVYSHQHPLQLAALASEPSC